MKFQLLFLFLISNIYAYPHSDSITSNNRLEEEIGILSQKVIKLEEEIKLANANIDNVNDRHKEQVKIYGTIQNIIIWVVSIIFILISGSFVLFFKFYKKTQELFNEINQKLKESKFLLEKLERQYQHQISILILGEKGIYSYTSSDWKLIENYSKDSELISETKRSFNDWIFIGLNNYRLEQFSKSINAFNKAVTINPDSELAYRNLANALDANGDSDGCIKCLKKALKINPKNEKTYNNLGIAYGAKDMFPEALDNFLKAISLNDNDGYLYTNLFELCLVNGIKFDKNLEKVFKSRFKNDIAIFSIYEMLLTYKRIANEGNANKHLKTWENKYFSIGYGENYLPIEKWVNNKTDPRIKKELERAIDFFKFHDEK